MGGQGGSGTAGGLPPPLGRTSAQFFRLSARCLSYIDLLVSARVRRSDGETSLSSLNAMISSLWEGLSGSCPFAHGLLCVIHGILASYRDRSPACLGNLALGDQASGRGSPTQPFIS